MGNDASKPSDAAPLTPNTEKKRRIVKAVKPAKQTETKPSVIVMPMPDLDKEEKEDPSSAEQVKLTVKTTVQPKTKAKREQKLQQHRLTPKAANSVETKQPATPVATPNPMSRFLSAFSVEPKHPEHKRRATEGIPDPDTPKPSEKRLRAQDDSDVGDAADHDDDGETTRGSLLLVSSTSITILLSTAALVVAVVATAWWRSGNKKR